MKARRYLIAAGDPCQLPPVVAAPAQVKAPNLASGEGVRLFGIARPLFERLVAMGHKRHLLRCQYRQATVTLRDGGGPQQDVVNNTFLSNLLLVGCLQSCVTLFPHFAMRHRSHFQFERLVFNLHTVRVINTLRCLAVWWSVHTADISPSGFQINDSTRANPLSLSHSTLVLSAGVLPYLTVQESAVFC